MGEPVCGEQGAPSPPGQPGTPRHASTEPSPQKGSFFLAYILQQYRNSQLQTQTGAVPVPAGAVVPVSHHLPAWKLGSSRSWELPTALTTPLACTGYPGYPACTRGPSGRAGGAERPSPQCHCCSEAQLASGELFSS